MTRIVGIDLGTTNTCAAFVSNKIPRVIPIEEGFNTMPSVVAMPPDGSVLVGQRAREQIIRHPELTFHDLKRLVGRQFGSRTVQELRQRFAYQIVSGENGLAAVMANGKAQSITAMQSHILAQIKRYVEIQLGQSVPEAVIAVPAYFTDHQRSLVKEAGQMAGWAVRRIVNEPTAAALAYGFNRGFDQKILIYDLGGGTFDVSILELTGNVFQVLATGGDTFLGGADFDDVIIGWIVEQCRRNLKVDVADDREVLYRLRPLAEKAKMELSLLANTQIRAQGFMERRGKGIDLDLLLDRDTLNGMTRSLVQRTLNVIDALLAEVGMRASDIDEVILVGGQTRMPLVADMLTAHLGKAPRKGVHPDECVALGAALLGDSLAKIDAVTLLDALSVPICLASPDGRLRKVIDKHTKLPHSAATQITTHSDDQPSFEIDIFQGEGESVMDAEYLGTLFYHDVPSAPAGGVTLELEFQLDEEGMLLVQAKNSVSGNPQRLRLAIVERPAQHATDTVQESPAPRQMSEPEGAGLRGFVKGLWGKR